MSEHRLFQSGASGSVPHSPPIEQPPVPTVVEAARIGLSAEACIRDSHVWAIVLAAGEGSRVRSFTTDAGGESVPKQFCSFGNGVCLIQHALDRAAGVVARTRVVTVVAAQHRRWWQPELSKSPRNNVVIQPRNRGTGCGILLPLAQILRRDPHARVVILPSDHVVANEAPLREALVKAVLAVRENDRRVVLLGMAPQECDTEYGWIVPAAHTGDLSVQTVEAFVEKPNGERARALMRRGAVLNTFIFAASGATLLRLFEDAAPRVLERFAAWRTHAPDDPEELEALYEDLPTCDFSREILERSSDRLSVARVPGCGWLDVGTPERLKIFREQWTSDDPAHPTTAPAAARG